MMKRLLLIGCMACLAAACKKDPAIPEPAGPASTTTQQTDSLAPFVGTYRGVCNWSVAGGSSGTFTAMLTTTESSDKLMLYVHDSTSLFPFAASPIIHHQTANNSGPSSSLSISSDSLLMFVIEGSGFYHYYCKKQ